MTFNKETLQDHCWDTPNGVCSTSTTEGTTQQDYSSIFSSLYLVYMLLIITGILPKIIDIITKGEHTKRLSKYAFKQIFWIHGMATFTTMYMLQPHNLRMIASTIGTTSNTSLSFIKYSLQSVLAFILYDLLIKQQSKIKLKALLHCHHLGLFLAIYFGQGWEITSTDETLKKQVQLDSCLYGWMWAIHSFGFILKYIFPLIGVHVHEGERSVLLDRIKYAYSMVTVYWYYQVFNAESQLGVGCNYQTLSLLTMLIGRFVPNTDVPFLRRVEMPGMFIILLDGLFFKDECMQRSIAIAMSMLGAWAVYYCLIKKHTPKPDKFFGPDKNPKLKAFLESETQAVHAKDEKEAPMKKLIQSWFDGQTVDEKKHSKKLEDDSFASYYPLHSAVVKDDAELVEKILMAGGVDVNQPLLEHGEATPLQFSSYFLSKCDFGHRVFLVLLKHGANPYIKDEQGRDVIDSRLNASLGNSQDFFFRYNKICLEKSPAKLIFSELSLLEKMRLVPL